MRGFLADLADLAALAALAALASLAVLGVVAAGFATSEARAAGHGPRALAARAALVRTLSANLQAAGGSSGAYVVDLNTGRQLYASAAGTGRLPGSVEKLYTTSTALLRFGPDARFSTSALGTGSLVNGIWDGTLYLKGGGDPTFGSASFDHIWYGPGTGATMQQLVSNLVRQTGISQVNGAIVGDQSYLDSLRGTPATRFQGSSEVEGLLGGLVYNRGLLTPLTYAFQRRPTLFTTQQLVSALRAGGVGVPAGTPVSAAPTPAGAQVLAAVRSPRVAWLIRMTNTPSDNFIAEMLLKDLGTAFGGAGTTAAGAGVVRAQMASFGIQPQLNDGSGLSRSDYTSPRQVVTLLAHMAGNRDFVNSLAIAGRTGTLQHEMNRTIAQGRCVGKTGTLIDVADLAGYCTARDGHRLAFAFLINGLGDPAYGHQLEANMAVALAGYNG